MFRSSSLCHMIMKIIYIGYCLHGVDIMTMYIGYCIYWQILSPGMNKTHGRSTKTDYTHKYT